ncbi:hypothetical protein ACJVC5_17555 [Peredibacter sp. HCB2-198]|uniref:hypothetical protein n=1 Tax=Peredibacter sp. HCB2-198 TaxID=3383025 RepID=UPI0038B4A25C
MKNSILSVLLLLLCQISHAGLIDDPLLKKWQVITKGSKAGNTMESYERKIVTPYSQFTVAQMTNMELNFTGPQTIDSVRDFLSKEFRLVGLHEKKLNGATRFEGYRPDINRQVVVFVSFKNKKIKVSSGFYRPAYGRVIALEVELLHRKYHKISDKVSSFPIFKILNPFIEEAYAQTDCTKCAGNPMCLLLCRSGNSSTGSLPGGLDLSSIQSELVNANSQLTALNGNLGNFNTNIGVANNNLANSNVNWANTNTQIGNINNTLNNQMNGVNANWANTNTQIGNLNNNWANTNTQIGNLNTSINTQVGTFNQNYAETNAQLQEANKNIKDFTTMADKRADEALKESQAWRAMTEKESQEWRALAREQSDRGLVVAEKMVDPKHLFKMATYSAAGAVLGASVANLAISGVTTAVSFLYKWATGELKEMKQAELLREFANAMKVYEDTSKISKGLELSIDSALASMALHKKFQLENSEVLANIQKYILETEFQIEDAKKNRCIEELVPLNQKLVEFQSLAKILDMADPQKKMCLDLKEMFRKLAEVEGVLQNARPNLLKAEEALNWQLAREQNEGAEILEDIQKGKLAKEVKKTQDKQREELYERNKKDTEKLVEDIVDDCRDSFRVFDHNIKRGNLKKYCESLLTNKEAATPEGLYKALPELNDTQRKQIMREFKKKYVQLGIDKVEAYEKQRKELFSDFEKESARHHEEVSNLKDRVQLDPRIALNEMKAINEFVEKLMKEQAYIYSDGMRVKKAQFEEACQSLSE